MEPNIVAQPPVTEPVVEQKIEPKNPFTRWLLVFAGLVLLAILFSGVYFLGIYQGMSQKPASKTPTQTVVKSTPTPTPDPTAGWKTYSNTKYGFSFKYPPAFNILVENDVPDQFLLSIKGQSAEYGLDIGPQGKVPGSDLAYGKYPLNSKPNGTKIVNGSMWEIITPIIYGDAGMSGSTYPTYQFTTNKFRYDFQQRKLATTGDADIFMNILSSFKTADQAAQSGETANWKTYKSPEGFSIRFPEGWSINDQSYHSANEQYLGFAIQGPLRSDIAEANGKSAYYVKVLKLDSVSGTLIPNEAYGNTGEEFILQKDPGDQAPNKVSVSDDFIRNSSEHKTADQIISTFKFAQ